MIRPLCVVELHACADPDCLGTIRGRVARLWADVGGVSAIDQMMFEMAVIDIASNIVRHGRPESTADGSMTCNLILEVYSDRLDARFRDDGRTAHVDAAAMPGDLPENGTGLAMAKAAMDVLRYERCDDANYWTLSRTRTRIWPPFLTPSGGT